MGKRASLGGGTGRPAKVKVVDEQTILSQIFAGEKLPVECRDMLKASVPHAISTAPDVRHAFQNQMIDVVVTICGAKESRHRAEVDSAKAEISSLEGKRTEATANVERANGLAAAKDEVKKAKASAVIESQNAIDDAKSLLNTEKEKEMSFCEQNKVVLSEKTEHEEALQTVWEPLKTTTFDGIWQKRNKAITRIIGMIEKTGAPPSLTGALGVALKQKVDARAIFGNKAIEHGEAMLKDHITSLGSKIAGLDVQSADIVNSIEAAVAALKAAEDKLATAQNESITAENEWVEEESAAVLAKDAVETLRVEAEDAAQLLTSAEAVLTTFLELKAKFDGFKDHIKAPEEEDGDKVEDAPMTDAGEPQLASEALTGAASVEA